jgi:hypothetical protein
MPPVVDLTISESDSDIEPAAPARPKQQQRTEPQAAQPADVQQPNEADQRKRIMEFAQSVAAKRRQMAPELTNPQPSPAAGAAAAEAEPGARPEPAAAFGSGVGGNSLLAQLAREREARRKQQADSSSSPDKGAASAAGAPGSNTAAAGGGGGSKGSGGAATTSGASKRTAAAAAAAAAPPAAAVGTGRRLDGQPVRPAPKQAFSLMTYNVW